MADGLGRRIGGVACVTGVRNPVLERLFRSTPAGTPVLIRR